jgi:hypothetical protein
MAAEEGMTKGLLAETMEEEEPGAQYSYVLNLQP